MLASRWILVAVALLNAGSLYALFPPSPSGISSTNSLTGHLAPLHRRRGWIEGRFVPMSQDTLPSSWLEQQWTLVGFREEPWHCPSSPFLGAAAALSGVPEEDGLGRPNSIVPALPLGWGPSTCKGASGCIVRGALL